MKAGDLVYGYCFFGVTVTEWCQGELLLWPWWGLEGWVLVPLTTGRPEKVSVSL